MDAIQLISTTAIAVLAGVTTYLGLRKYRPVFVAVGQKLMMWFAFLLYVLFVMRIFVLINDNLLSAQKFVNSLAFFITVIGIIWSVSRYERTHKR